jgi:hypothetical protein
MGGSEGGTMLNPQTGFPRFLGYWKDTRSFCVGKKEDKTHIEHCVPTTDKTVKLGSSFSGSLAYALSKGHKYFALKKGSSAKNSELLTFNQLHYGSKVEYNYDLPSDDHHDKMAGCSHDVCKEKYDLMHELWAVYQLYS